VSLVWTTALHASQASRPAAERPCHEHPQVVDKCFRLRGRMNYANGSPTVRIWPVGTGRVLGVSEGRFAVPGIVNLPSDLQARLSWESDLFADFIVCPFTPDQPGVMRLVCVDAATNVVVRATKRSGRVDH